MLGLSAYASSGSESGSSDVEEPAGGKPVAAGAAPAAPAASAPPAGASGREAPRKAASSGLPSASALLDGASGASVPEFLRASAGSIGDGDAAPKEGAARGNRKRDRPKKKTSTLTPPQAASRRPNVSTEDTRSVPQVPASTLPVASLTRRHPTPSAWFRQENSQRQQGAAAIAMLEAEKERKKREKHETFNQKEKRKRVAGQVSRQGSFVEEEKRILRQHGMG